MFSVYRTKIWIASHSKENLNLNISYKTINSSGKSLKHNKETVRTRNQVTYPLVYVGQTGRAFENRIKEHQNSFVKNKSNSTYANHLQETRPDFDNNFEMLHIENTESSRSTRNKPKS